MPFRDCESGLFEIGLQGALNSISIPQLKEFLFALQNYFTFMGKISDGTRLAGPSLQLFDTLLSMCPPILEILPPNMGKPYVENVL